MTTQGRNVLTSAILSNVWSVNHRARHSWHLLEMSKLSVAASSRRKVLRTLKLVKTLDCVSGFHWSALKFSQTFASVFSGYEGRDMFYFLIKNWRKCRYKIVVYIKYVFNILEQKKIFVLSNLSEFKGKRNLTVFILASMYPS